MDPRDVQEWFEAYLETFAAFGRGDRNDVERLLGFYAVPLLVTTDRGARTLDSEVGVARALEEQIVGMRTAGYSRSDLLESRVEILNAVSALYVGDFSRRRSDGSEIERLRVTYLITDHAADRRIGALVVHSAKHR